MTILNVIDQNTGDIVAIDIESPLGSLYSVDANTGDLVLLDLVNTSGTLNVVDANTGDIVEIDYDNPVAVFNVNDPNTGQIVEIDLSNPTGSLYVQDANTGEFILVDLSTGKVITVNGVTVLAGGGASETPLQSILTKFEITPRSVGYTKEASNIPAMLYDIGSGLCICMKFDQSPVALSNVPKIAATTARRILVGVNERDEAAVTKVGTWGFGGTGNNNAYGGDYTMTATAGEYFQWVTPTATIVHGWGLGSADNAGVCVVSIDGDNTLANLLPTAQALVDAETLASTVLIANGGTLNPTDRIWDQYASRTNYFSGKTFADNLSSASHTVRVTATAYKNAASSQNRCYISGFGSWANSVTLADTNVVVGHVYETISTEGSVWEFAHNYQPTVGGTVDEWMGHSGSDKLDSWTVTVDGVAVDPAAFTVAGGQEVKVVIASTLSHTEAASCASMVLTHTLTPDKLTVHPVLTWNTAGTVFTGYVHMLPGSESVFDKGSNVADTEDHVLTVGNGLFVANFQSQAAYMWDADGYYGALFYLPDLAGVNNWMDCDTNFLAIEDRIGNGLNKIYCTRTDSNLVVSPNDVFDSTAEYRIKRFSGGANTTLARE